MGLELGLLAEEVGVSERTIRRGVASRLIRAARPGSGGIALTDAEAAWVRGHWHIVGELRAALRTEHNVELAVLFGSTARGEEVAGISDVDLLVGLRQPATGALGELGERLSRRLDFEPQLVSCDVALRNPLLLAEIARDGRPLIDRGAAWARLRARAEGGKARAGRQLSDLRSEARVAVEYFRELAAERARAPLAGGS